MTIKASTTLCAVIGNPVLHSLSPAIHNAGYAALGLNYAYLAFQVSDVAGALNGVRALGIRGLSVTIPHKQAVIEHLDSVDALAEQVGSVNTIVNTGGMLHGCTTDGPGALRAVREAGVNLTGRRVVLLGNGGSARAVGAALLAEEQPSSLVILGRNPEKVSQLTEDLGAHSHCPVLAGPLDARETAELTESAALIVNTTSVGMHPHVGVSPLSAEYIPPGSTVFDIVYTPRRTRLLEDAQQRGARVIYGLEMFLYQAVLQFELFTQQEAPLPVMRQVVESALA